MTKKETYKLKTSISEDLNLKNVFVDSAENWYLDPGDLFSTPRLDTVTLGSGQRGISPHWINTISRRNEMRRKRNIHQVILYCLFIIGVFQLHYKILWYLWSMHAQKIKFSFVIWSLLFGFHKPALQKMSLAFMFCLLIIGHVIILFYWRTDVSFDFPLIHMHICMHVCTVRIIYKQ